jgi:hypothetical protein
MSEIPHQDLFRPADLLVALDRVVTAGKTTDDNEIFAEATNEPGLEMVCQRCGRMRSLEEGTTVKERRRGDDMPGGKGGGNLT